MSRARREGSGSEPVAHGAFHHRRTDCHRQSAAVAATAEGRNTRAGIERDMAKSLVANCGKSIRDRSAHTSKSTSPIMLKKGSVTLRSRLVTPNAMDMLRG